MSTNAGGTAQGTSGIPPVETEDIKPQDSKTTEAPEKATSPKTGNEQATESQPSTENDEGAKEKGPGPWDAELSKRGIADPKVDAFLREVVQPYVTQLEQGGGGEIDSLFEGDREMAEAAKELLQPFLEDPEAAYRDLGELLGISPGDPGDGVNEQGTDDLGYSDEDLGNEPAPEDERLSYVDDLMRREREAQEDAEYANLLQQVGAKFGEGFDEDLFTDLILASGGNVDRAISRYSAYHRAPDPAPTAPPVNGQGNTPPPEAPQFNSIDEAIEHELAEQRARRSK